MNRKRQEALTQAAAAHRDSIQKSLQRRIEAARSRGDDNLLRMLEAEASYFNR